MPEIKKNSLYLIQPNFVLTTELETIVVENKNPDVPPTNRKRKVPFHHVQSIVLLETNYLSPELLNRCLKKGISVIYLNQRNKFLGCLESSKTGNVLLRKEQFRKSDDQEFKLKLSKSIIAGKLQNSRANLLRSARETKDIDAEKRLRESAETIANNIIKLETATTLDELRGYEGSSAKKYFSVFDDCIVQQKEDFHFDKRTKRPPRSRINALLSFFYSIMTTDCISAIQTVGLDPFIGYLHEERSGKPSLALDLIEEFRAFVDRFIITIINRKQIKKEDIIEKVGSVYSLNETKKREIIALFHERKNDEIIHPYLEQKTTFAQLPYLQAQILARVIRRETKIYIPFLWK